MMFRSRYTVLVACLASVVAVLVAGVGSSSGRTPATSSKVVASAKAAIAPYLVKPSKIVVGPPLKRKPPKKTVAWLTGNTEAYAASNDGGIAGAHALGWKINVITYDPTNPTSVNAAFQTAVNEHVNYIEISSLPVAEYAQALANAKAAHIPVIDYAAPENPATGPNGNGIYFSFASGAYARLLGKLLEDWIIVDSHGQGDQVWVNEPLYPVLSAIAQGGQAEAKKCSGCGFDLLNLSGQQIAGGQVPSVMSAYVEAHPSLKYMAFTIGAFDTGVSEALKSAGIGQNIEIVGNNLAPADLEAVRTGAEKMFVLGTEEEASWHVIDAMARLSEGMSLKHVPTVAPIWMLTHKNVPNTSNVANLGTTNYRAQFMRLWHVTK